MAPPIADRPGNDLNWFAPEGFPPGQLGQLLALMHEIDHNGIKQLLRPLRSRALPPDSGTSPASGVRMGRSG